MIEIKSCYDRLMERIEELQSIKEDGKSIIKIVLDKKLNTTCILRICMKRDLSAVCEQLMDVKNPNLVTIYDYVYANGNTYILEEQIDGTTLDKELMEGRFTPQKTAEIIMQVCDGLEAFHKREVPIVHNDIKPSNIMLRKDGGIKIIDFDISCLYDPEKPPSSERYLTPEYASPEQYGYSFIEPRSDLYGLGVVMHEMLTGKILKENKSPFLLVPFRRIIKKCVNQVPKKRPKNVAALKKMLARALRRRKNCWWYLIALLGMIALLLVGSKTLPIKPPSAEQAPQNSVAAGATLSEKEENEGNEGKKKSEPAYKLEAGSELVSMVVRQDGSPIYLERSEDQYFISSSSGAKQQVALSLESNACCGLIYNPHEDLLYFLAAEPAFDTALYAVNAENAIDSTPIYQAQTGDYRRPNGMFFSDGTLYCSAFAEEWIDLKNQVSLGGIDATYDALIKDCGYYIDLFSNELVKEDSSGSHIKRFPAPVRLSGKDQIFSNNDELFFIGSDKDEKYIYRFDGEQFSKVLCFSDIAYEGATNYDKLFVYNDVIYLYNKSLNIIKKIEL